MPTVSHAKKSRFAKAAHRIAAAERAIQKHIDRKDSRRSKAPKTGAMQADEPTLPPRRRAGCHHPCVEGRRADEVMNDGRL